MHNCAELCTSDGFFCCCCEVLLHTGLPKESANKRVLHDRPSADGMTEQCRLHAEKDARLHEALHPDRLLSCFPEGLGPPAGVGGSSR